MASFNRSRFNAQISKLRTAQRRLESAARDLDRLGRRARSASRSLPSTTQRFTVVEQELLDRTFTAVQEDPTPREYDLFLCHAWPDRRGAAAELDAALREQGLEVWFSEREVRLGESLARQLDTGLKTSHVGLVLVTPAFLQATGGWAEREMYALLSGERVIPVLHGVTFEELKARSRLLADVVGLSTSEDLGFAEIAEAIADEVLPAEAA